MLVAIDRELSATPGSGTLPLGLSLSFRARALDAPGTVDVIYRIAEPNGESWNAAFATPQGPVKVLRKAGIALTALSQKITQVVQLVPAGAGNPPVLLVIDASVVDPTQPDDAAVLQRTADMVRIGP